MNSIAIYPSHDSSITVQFSDSYYRVFEFERFFKKRYCSLLKQSNEDFEKVIQKVYDICLDEWYKLNDSYILIEPNKILEFIFENCYYSQLTDFHKDLLKKYFKVQNFIEVGHHISHAACSFYQSSFEEALVISYDGGGADEIKENELENIERVFLDRATLERVTYFNIYHANRNSGKIERIANFKFDLGTAYGLTALPIKEINKGQNWEDTFLSFAGKLMGLVAYGKVRNEWLDAFKDYYKRHKWVSETDLNVLGNDLKLGLSINNLSVQTAYDFVATSQKAFENLILECILPIISKPDYLLLAK
jgi:predicted NodU family carbamoyl transferase